MRRSARVSSWLAGALLAEQIPVLSVDFEESDTQAVPEKVTLRVPVEAAGGPWDPTGDPLHPLGRFGQRLLVTVDWATPRGASGSMDLGWFQIQEWDLDDTVGVVEVTAHGLLQLVEDDKLPRATQPAAGATFASEVRRLLPGGMPVSFDPTLVNRAVPSGFSWEEDRLGAILDLVEAWPARITVTPTGTVLVRPPLGLEPRPVVTLTDGEHGVLIKMPRSDSRNGCYSAVVASSSQDTSSSTPVTGQWQATTGPYATATYGVVRKRVASQALGSAAAAAAMARTTAEASQRQSIVREVTLPPDLRIERGDAVALIWNEKPYRGWVQDASWPVHVPDGENASPMSLKVVCPL